MDNPSLQTIPAIHYEQTGAVWQLSEHFLLTIPFNSPLLFCCIGTDRSTGDALGPLIGSQLQGDFAFPFPIIGTLEKPLHALNLQETVEGIHQQIEQPFIIAIDACLGEERAIGQILLQHGPLYPGRAVKKKLPPIGDLSIKGIVNVGGYMETTVLQNTRLHVTTSIADKIARGLLLAWQRHLLKGKYNRHNHSNNQNTWQQIRYADFR
ncbi:MAG: spore protease YyaC [Solibacillus sp.]